MICSFHAHQPGLLSLFPRVDCSPFLIIYDLRYNNIKFLSSHTKQPTKLTELNSNKTRRIVSKGGNECFDSWRKVKVKKSISSLITWADDDSLLGELNIDGLSLASPLIPDEVGCPALRVVARRISFCRSLICQACILMPSHFPE